MRAIESNRQSRTAPILAVLLALAGLLDIGSALTPALRLRVHLLQELVGTPAIRFSQTATVLAGIVALMLAQSLARRNRRAAQLAMVVLLASALLNLLKGIDFEEASFCLFVAWMLWRARAEFVVPGLPISWRVAAGRTTRYIGFTMLYAEAGALLLGRGVRVSMMLGPTSHPVPFLLAAFVSPWTDAPTVRYVGPQGIWFQHSLFVLGIVGVIYATVRLLRPMFHSAPATADERASARALVERFGTDSLSYFHLRPDRSYLFAPDGQGFVSYVVRGDIALLGGDPVAAPGRTRPLIRHALDVFAANGLRVCVIGASAAAMADFRAEGMRCLKIGEEAVIDLKTFDAGALAKRVRRAARAIGAQGVEIRFGRMQDLDPGLVAQCRTVSQAWLQAHGGVEQGFSMTSGPLPAGGDGDHHIVLGLTPAKDGEAERLLGFLTLAPVPAAHSLSLDHMRRCPDAPNGLMEALIIRASEHYKAQGFTGLSLNFATLSDKERPEGEPAAMRAARSALFENAKHLPLRSLYDFNRKFSPAWSCRYWLYDGNTSLLSAAIATVRAEVATAALLPGPLGAAMRAR